MANSLSRTDVRTCAVRVAYVVVAISVAVAAAAASAAAITATATATWQLATFAGRSAHVLLMNFCYSCRGSAVGGFGDAEIVHTMS